MQDEKTKMDRLVPTRTVPGARHDRWPASGLGEPIVEEIVTLREFERAIRSWASASASGRARVETDLRTHWCASRPPIIARAADRLAGRLASCCPDCGSPGWGWSSVCPARDVAAKFGSRARP